MFVLGNEGSFANTVIQELKLKSANKIIEKYLIKKDCNSGLAIKNSISWIKKFNAINSPIIFIGGETRNKDKMYLMNVILPYCIYLEAEKNNVRFIYLSSLSVFGLPNSRLITFKSEMKPIDLYGKTKFYLDDLLFSTSFNGLSAIFPGSIISKKRPNLLAKINKYRDNSIISFLFRLFPFVGGISISNPQMIANAIYLESLIKVSEKSRRIFCTEFIGLESVSKYLKMIGVNVISESIKPIFKVKYLSLFIVKLLTIFLPYNLRRRIIFFTIPIYYK